jgi:hypothetical protein
MMEQRRKDRRAELEAESQGGDSRN